MQWSCQKLIAHVTFFIFLVKERFLKWVQYISLFNGIINNTYTLIYYLVIFFLSSSFPVKSVKPLEDVRSHFALTSPCWRFYLKWQQIEVLTVYSFLVILAWSWPHLPNIFIWIFSVIFWPQAEWDKTILMGKYEKCEIKSAKHKDQQKHAVM